VSVLTQLSYFPSYATSPRSLICAVTTNGLLVKDFITCWHSTLPAPTGWRIAFLLLDGLAILGVSTWGRPTARLEDQEYTLEHTRMALSYGAPRNSGSWFLARNREWIRKNMPEIGRVIAYINLDHHTGIVYRADNWQTVYREYSTSSWTNRPGRLGTEANYRAKFERAP